MEKVARKPAQHSDWRYNKHMKFARKLVLSFGLVVIGLAISLSLSGRAQAATNGRMIDDTVFDASNSMSAADIQNFLNQFPNSCLKNYTDDMPVADPTQAYFQYSGTGTAAQIIRRVADNWGMNPRVLLAKLEQESNLVTGSGGCQLWRQASAIGFKCYDGASLRTTTFKGQQIQTCVATDADMGVARQLSKGGWLLKWGKERANGNLNWLVSDDASYYYGGPMTQGNRKRSATSPLIYFDGYWNGVYLESGATASLYNYTPYLNQAFDDIWEGWWGAGSTLGDPCVESAKFPLGFIPAGIGIFSAGADGEVQCRIFANGWQQAKLFTGNTPDTPAVLRYKKGVMAIFVRGGDNALWQKRLNGNWSEWRNLGGGIKDYPAVVGTQQGVIDVFVRGLNDSLWHRRYTDWLGWGDWSNLGGLLTAAPTVSKYSDGVIDVFVRGGDGELYQRRFAQVWQPWQKIGGAMNSAPSAVVFQPGIVDVFARSGSNTLIQKRYIPGAGWTSWIDLGGVITSAPNAFSPDRGVLDIFGKGSANQLVHRRFYASWLDWEDLGGVMSSSPAAFSN